MSTCTTEIKSKATNPSVGCRSMLQGRRLVIVDTPGFNNHVKALTDKAILLQIADWLERRNRLTLGGIIYLQDINSDRISLAELAQTALRASFSSDTTFGKLVFATTKWDRLSPGLGEDPESKFNDFLKGLTNQDKLKLHRLRDDGSNAWEIVEALLDHDVDSLKADIESEVNMLKRNFQTSKQSAVLDLPLKLFQQLQAKWRAQYVKSIGGLSAKVDTTKRI
ncbi:hypothetical protein GALMADRAFT_135551 [Galerina marginata CBS 339.88]|uniref:G domain-containing protein n=1 Tax=Galerina marginata (strain CBS 339.88) TaxID=685588 RepID=A0A067TT79_GALM3|nr:hypothetical protein GALMADRAFT_135551 [Galerina marginata CBS 339.88]